MARSVTKYEADDGKLFDSYSECQRYEEERGWRNSFSMLAHYTAGELDEELLVDWLLAHKGIVSQMERWPAIKESELADYLKLEKLPEAREEDAYLEAACRISNPAIYAAQPAPF